MNDIKTAAFLREKNAQIQQLSDAVCSLKGDLAVAESRIAALTERLNDLTAEEKPAETVHSQVNGSAQASA